MSNAQAYFARLAALKADLNRHDVEAASGHLNEASLLSRGDGASWRGSTQFAIWLAQLFAACPDAEIEINQIVALPNDTMLVEWRLSGTSLGEIPAEGDQAAIPANGGRISAAGAALLTFDTDALISRLEVRADTAALLAQLGTVPPPEPDVARLAEFATAYTAAWCSQDAASVAMFFGEDGGLTINGGASAIGREAIMEVVRGFMDVFPDLEVIMDDLHAAPEAAVYAWRLKGTHRDTGQKVHIGGIEVWQIDADGLIANSNSYFDTGAYDDQVNNGAAEYRV
jgi:steroid delta-isomerase-like uncharacterized protein